MRVGYALRSTCGSPHPFALQMWPTLDNFLAAMMRTEVTPLLNQQKPPLIAKMGFAKFTLGAAQLGGVPSFSRSGCI